MLSRKSIRNSIVISFVIIFILSVLVITILNNVIARNTIKNNLINSEIPAIIENIIGDFNEKIVKTVSGMSVVAEDSFLQEWILEGEPESDLPKIKQRLENNSNRFNTMGSNIVIWKSGNYYNFDRGRYELKYITEVDVWFEAFKRSGLSSNINAYTNHEVFGEVAFINVRIDHEGEFLGVVSVSLDLSDFVKSVVNRKIGDNGSTFMVDSDGLLTLHSDKTAIGKINYTEIKEYKSEFINITSNNKHSFSYNKDGDTIFVNTVFIPELNWYLVTEASQNELFKAMNNVVISSTILVLLLAAIGVLIFIVIINNIIKPLKYAVSIADTIKDGDLTIDVSINREDEVGSLLYAIRDMKDNLLKIVENVKTGSGEMSAASTLLSSENQKLADRTESQAASIEETAATIEEMNGSIRSNFENTVVTAGLSREALEKTKEGTKAVSEMIDSMNDIDMSSNKISEIIEVINSIAFQTNLLALNASIEAARAGEQGKGFAVVAVEVRKLAKKSDRAASEIATIIKSNNSKIEEGVSIANKAGDMLDQIKDSVNKVSSLTEEISLASKEQLSSIDQIDSTLENLDQNTQLNSSLADQIAASTEELSAQSVELKNTMEFFEV